MTISSKVDVELVRRVESYIGESYPVQFLVDLTRSSLEAVTGWMKDREDVPEEIKNLVDSASVLGNILYYRVTDQIAHPETDYSIVPDYVTQAITALYKMDKQIERW